MPDITVQKFRGCQAPLAPVLTQALVCWFLGKTFSNFVSPNWKLHNPYYHIVYKLTFGQKKLCFHWQNATYVAKSLRQILNCVLPQRPPPPKFPPLGAETGKQNYLYFFINNFHLKRGYYWLSKIKKQVKQTRKCGHKDQTIVHIKVSVTTVKRFM